MRCEQARRNIREGSGDRCGIVEEKLAELRSGTLTTDAGKTRGLVQAKMRDFERRRRRRYGEPNVMVYLMTGFLDSGKTQFLNFTLKQDYFQIDGKTLLILCEEGEEEYRSYGDAEVLALLSSGWKIRKT